MNELPNKPYNSEIVESLLQPRVTLFTEKSICPCGAQNFRLSENKPIKHIYQIRFPTGSHAGGLDLRMCVDCINSLYAKVTDIENQPLK